MYRHTMKPARRRAGLLIAGLVAGAGVLSAVAASPASAETVVGTVVAPEYGLDKVTTKIHIIDQVGVISRLPQVEGTADDATKLNATPPKVVCTGPAGTVTPTSEYASEEGVITIVVVFADVVDAKLDKCTLSNSTYVQATGDTVYPFSQSARTALWGEPKKALADANKRLKSAIPALRKAYADHQKSGAPETYLGAWSEKAAARVDKTLTNYTVESALFSFEASSTSPKTMYLIRPANHGPRWVDLCQRLKDGRLPCLRFNPVTNKSKLWINYSTPNIYTEDITQEPAAS